jgi:hypothetical protein
LTFRDPFEWHRVDASQLPSPAHAPAQRGRRSAPRGKKPASFPELNPPPHLHAQLRAVGAQQLLGLPADLLRQLAAGRKHEAPDRAAQRDLRGGGRRLGSRGVGFWLGKHEGAGLLSDRSGIARPPRS